MKSKKEAQRTSRKLLDAAMASGRLDLDLVRVIIRRLSASKPRGYFQLIEVFWRLVKLEIAKHEATVESAVPLGASMQGKVLADLKSKYGDQVKASYIVNPELIGGMRIKIGSDVWDGSVRNRIERLNEKFSK